VACTFCELPSTRIIARNDHAIAIRDAFPVSPGHTLVIPVRHVGSFFETTAAERQAMLELLDQARSALQQELRPDSYNIGINDGPAAGQTINHMHLHLIPRYLGDCADPRGGVRWIKPSKAAYWQEEE